MKAQKKLNIVLVVLIVLLLALISFVGIYYKNKNKMENILPDYLLGTDLTGYRKVMLEVSEEESEEENTEENEEESKEDESEVNKAGDYRKSAEVIKNRLKALKVEEYTVSCDESTGAIEITLPEDDRTDIILSDITQIGKFSINDAESKEELISNYDVRSVDVKTQEATYNGTTYVYMDINFNTKGAKKFKDITKNYQNVVEEESEEENENSENSENSDEENAVSENKENEENQESEAEESKSKEVVLVVDDVDMLTTNFDEIVDNGVLSLTLGTASTEEDLKDRLYSAENLAAILENDAMPLQYQITGNTYIASTIEEDTLNVMIYLEIAVALLIGLVIIIKFRAMGVLTTILSIGYLAILLMAIRFANVSLSTEGILAIELSFMINCILGCMTNNKIKDTKLNKKEKIKLRKELVKKYNLILMPELIIALVCCFTQWAPIFSFGMVMFWGMTISYVYNIIINEFLLR